jgi:hypothetical protein
LFGSLGDLAVSVGLIAYLIFYLLGLAYFIWRSIRGHRFLTIVEITLSVVLAMVGSVFVFLITAIGFVK